MTRPTANPDLRVSLLLRDPLFVVVDKPAGVVTEPGIGHARDALLNGLLALEPTALGALGPARDWGLLHRLDRETSGCVLVALEARAYDTLRGQFELRTLTKEYLAVVRGRPSREAGEIDIPLVEMRRGDMKVSVAGRRGEGRPAMTRWRVLSSRREHSLLRVEIVSGRLHQIRAHCAMLGWPVDGDRVYRPDLPPNTSRPPPNREPPPLLLHAWRLAFDHPVDGHRVAVEAPLPPPLLAGAERCGASAEALASLLRSPAPVSIRRSDR